MSETTHYKFRCTPSTEAECFTRRLVGDNDGTAGEVKEEDPLFLHNIKYNVIYGPLIT